MQDPLAAATEAAEMAMLPLGIIREPSQALRGPERHDPKYAEMRDSIRDKGVLLPILVRPHEKEKGVYILVEGMQRYTLSKETGKTHIPARILTIDAVEALEVQIIANLHRIETSPMQYAEQLRLMMLANPKLTAPKLAVKLDKSPTWVYNMLGLVNLDPTVADLVEKGQIPVANAQAIAKLPQKDQGDYAGLAMDQTPAEFIPKMTAIARQIKEGHREGKTHEFKHVDHFQKMSDVKSAIDGDEIRRKLFQESNPTTPEAGFKLAIEWVLHRDPISQRAAKAKEAALIEKQQEKQKELDDEARKRRES